MPSSRHIPIFVDRDGDSLSVVLRDGEADPVISVTHNGNSQSVVMNDRELERVMRDLGDVFGFIVYKNRQRKK